MLTPRRLTATLAAVALAVGYFAVTAAAAVAMPVPPPDDSYPVAPAVHSVVTTTGSPLWVFVLVAATAAALTLAATFTTTRLLHARSRVAHA